MEGSETLCFQFLGHRMVGRVFQAEARQQKDNKGSCRCLGENIMDDSLISCLDDRLGDAATRRFFRPEEANHPTRITAKALTLELLTEGPRSLRRLLKEPEEDYQAAQLQWNLGDFTRYCTLTKLWGELFTWARCQGMATGQRASSWTPRGRLWQAVAKHIDWNVDRAPASEGDCATWEPCWPASPGIANGHALRAH